MTERVAPRVLVVDDDVRLLEALVRALETMGYDAAGEQEPLRGLERVRAWAPDAAIVDLKMPAMDGVELAERALEVQPDLPVIVLTGFGTVRSAVEAMRKGVYDYLTKPFDLDEVDLTLQKAIEHRRLRLENRQLARALGRPAAETGIVGESSAIARVLQRVSAVAGTDSTVLITGESGTGKELVARAIHGAGPRCDRPFVTVDCAAVSETLLPSELFGHVRGAFTGAHRDRAGYFEAAADGTVFLDEVGELDLGLQKKLLRVLEDKTFTRVGESTRRTTRARVVLATNRDLAEEVREGRFREDLYYRLTVVEIRLPPLRERAEDIPLLARHFLERLNRKLNRRVEGVSSEAMGALCAYPWPGNVRELANLLEQVLTFSSPRLLERDHLPSHVLEHRSPPLSSETYPELKERVLDEAGRAYLRTLLLHYRGKVTLVAKHAGLDRRHIHRLLNKFGMDPRLFRGR
ncbi:MAG: sigma-54 dependent transcriptional regulator [Deferrisomatales bacterium]